MPFMHSAPKHFTSHFKGPCYCREKTVQKLTSNIGFQIRKEEKPNRFLKIFSMPASSLCVALVPCLHGGNHFNFALKNALASLCNQECVYRKRHKSGTHKSTACCPPHSHADYPLRGVCLYLSLSLANANTLQI